MINLDPEEQTSESRGSSLEATPMVDVIFILLAFFVVVSQFKEQNLPLQLTQTQTGKGARKEGKSLLLQINSKNELYLAENKIALPDLERKLASMSLQKRKELSVQLRSDRQSKNGTFLEVLDLLKKYDINQINIAVRKS